MDSTLDRDSTCRTSDHDITVSGSRVPYKRPRVRKPRGRGLRTKSGCITCRKRHLKCDEVKPICGPCAKKDKPCEYASADRPIVNVLTPNGTTTEGPPGRSTQEASPEQDNSAAAAVPEFTPAELHDTAHLTCTASEAGNSPHILTQHENLRRSDLNSDHSPLSWQHDYLSPSNASFAAVQWFGLLASDAAYAAQESPQPITVPQAEGNEKLSIEYPGGDGPTQPSALQRATQVLDSPAATHTSHEPTDPTTGGSTLSEAQIWQSREQIELLPTEQVLFEHFLHNVSPWIDLFDPTSHFSTLVAHLAIRNAGLLNAILALALRHLALNPRLDDQDMPHKEESALRYYYQTLHYVQRAMQYSSYKTSLELLATALIISAYEMLDNSTNDWERHLEGVFLIQRSQTIHGESGGLHSAVWWAWLCQDIWAAFREKRKTLTFWVPQKPLSVLLPHELATRSIYIAAKVISYCADAATEEGFQRRIDGAIHLHTMLDDWLRHLTLEFSPLPLGSHEQSTPFRPRWIRPPAFAVAVQFFNVSYILLLAHEPSLGGMDQYLERQSIIRNCIEEICGIALTLKDAASSLMSSQSLFIGIFAQDQHARDAILELLESCQERTGWPVRSLGTELQHIWESHECTKATAAAKLSMHSVPSA